MKLSQRVLVHGLQVLALILVLEFDPTAPRFIERQPEYLLELVGVVTAAARVSPPPRQQAACTVTDGEVAGEARGLEIAVGPGLQLHLSALRDEPQRALELRAILHHRAEHHLIVAALRAAAAAHHPCLHEHCAAFEVPARARVARYGQVTVEQRLGVGGAYPYLAQKEVPPAVILRTRAIQSGAMRELMHGHAFEAVRGGDRFVRVVRRGEIESDHIVRCPIRSGIAEVLPVSQEHCEAVVGHVTPHALVVGERTEEALRGVRDERGLGRIVIDDPQVVVRFDERTARRKRRTGCESEDDGGRKSRPPPPGVSLVIQRLYCYSTRTASGPTHGRTARRLP